MGAAVTATNRPLHSRNDSTLCTEGFVGPRAGLERCKNPARTGIGYPAHLGRRESLYPLMPCAEITAIFFSVALQPHAGHGLLILEVYKSHTTTQHSR